MATPPVVPPQIGAPKHASSQKQKPPPTGPAPSPPQPTRSTLDVQQQQRPPAAAVPGGGEGGEPTPPPEEDDSPAVPMITKAEVRGVFGGIFMTFCGCFVFCGKGCASFWKDSAACCKDSRRAFCCSAMVMYMLAIMLVFLAFCVLIGAGVWSSAYYKTHYDREAKSLKFNATKVNATQDAKDAYKRWKEDPMWDYFPMQPRYWFSFFLGLISITAAFIQTPGRITTVYPDLLDDPTDDAEKRSCLCQLNLFNRLTQVVMGVAYILDLCFSWGFLIMASTFIEDNEDGNWHLFVPVYSAMFQFMVVSLAIVCASFGKWLAYKEAMRFTRGDMPDDEALEKNS